MSADIDDLTINYEEDGVQIVKELDKVVLSKGAWTTIIYRYQQLNRSKNEFGADMYTIRRYQKRNGQYMAKSKFNISSKAQAKKIVDALTNWIESE